MAQVIDQPTQAIVTLFGAGAQVAEAQGPEPQTSDRIAVWTQAYESWLSSRRRTNTRTAYQRAWEDFVRFTGKYPWRIGRTDVIAWIEDLRVRPVDESRHKIKTGRILSAATIGQMVAAVSSFYSFCNINYMVTTLDGREVPLTNVNPAKHAPRPEVPPFSNSFAFQPEESALLLQVIPRKSVIGKRNYALLLGYLATGRRNSEFRTLRWGQIRKGGSVVEYEWGGQDGIGKGKGQKNELPIEVWDAIQDYLSAAGRLETMQAEDYIFTALSDKAKRLKLNGVAVVGEDWKPTIQPISSGEVGAILRRYVRTAVKRGLFLVDLKKIHPHVLRHSAATLREASGDDIQTISKFLAHSSIDMTDRYMNHLRARRDGSWPKVATLLRL